MEREDMTKRLLRWGIVGTGAIAKTFARDLRLHASDIHELASIQTRDVEQATEFLLQNNLPKSRAFSDFDAFAASGIDVCYVATPHTTHVDMALRCLERNLHLLVEKPFAMNTQEMTRVFDLARRKNLFVMEAMWTRCIPAFQRAMRHIRDGEIGDVVSVDVDFGFDGSNSPARLMDPHLGGGALYDIGTYALQLGTLFSSPSPASGTAPEILYTASCRQPNGVDETFTAILNHVTADNRSVMLHMTLSVVENTACTAFVRGKKGYLLLEAPFHAPESFILNGKREEVKKEGHGLHYQTKEVYDCILKGKTESEIVPWNESLRWAQTLSRLAVFDQQK